MDVTTVSVEHYAVPANGVDYPILVTPVMDAGRYLVWVQYEHPNYYDLGTYHNCTLSNGNGVAGQFSEAPNFPRIREMFEATTTVATEWTLTCSATAGVGQTGFSDVRVILQKIS